MQPDPYTLARAGLRREEIAAIARCTAPDAQLRLLRKHRCKLLDEIHQKQQALDLLDYVICQIRGRP